MSNSGIDRSEEAYQRDQAEGERDDDMEQRVTRGKSGERADGTRQESVAERDAAEGRPDAGQ